MSTRGWYEYYAIDPAAGQMSLAMQFYKWGDATPENAVEEWTFLQQQVDKHHGRLPILWVDDLLREQLKELYPRLPAHFPVGVFFFLLQRAREGMSPWGRWQYRDLPKEQRPDYRLGVAVGKAMVLEGFPVRSHPDPYLNEIVAYLGAGHFVREWKYYGLRLSVLQWLQYLTQDTLRAEMGSIAGDFRSPSDIQFLYRFFIWLRPSEPFLVDRLSVELCECNGDDLFRHSRGQAPADGAWEDWSEVAQSIRKAGLPLDSLAEIRGRFPMIPDTFWRAEERPPLGEAIGV